MGINLSDDQCLFLKRKIEALERDIMSMIPNHDKFSSEHESDIVKSLEKAYKTVDTLNKILYYNETKALINLMR